MGTPPVPRIGLSATLSAGRSEVYDTDASREEEGGRGGRDGDVTPATAAAGATAATAEKSCQKVPTWT